MAEKQVLLGHQGGVPGVAFSPDGTMLASVAKDRTLRLWDVQSGAERAPAITVAGVGQAVAFSPDGRFLATADYTAGSAQVWDLPARREVATLKEGFGSRVHSVAFSPNGHYLAVGAVPGLQIFDVRDLARPRAPQQKQSAVRPLTPGPPGDSVGYLCFSPDSKLLAWTSNQGVVHLWDMEARRELPSPGRVFARIQSLAFLPDSRRLIFLNRERVAEVWDVRGARRVHSFPTTQASKGLPSSYAMHISLRPDGRWLAASSVSGCGVNLWEVESGRLLLPLPEEKGIVWSLAWSPDGQRLAVSRSEGGLAIWDCAQIRRQLAELGADWSAGG